MVNRHLVKRIMAVGLSITLNMYIFGTGNVGQEVHASEQQVTVLPEKSYGFIDSGYRAGKIEQIISDEPILMAKPIPQKYSSVEMGYVTPIRNQNPLGTCWAFAAVAAMESYALSHGLVDNPSDIDLSEYAVVSLAFDDRSFVDNVGTTAGDVTQLTGNLLNALNNGGNDSYVFKALSKWAGLYNESDVSYDTSGTTTVTYNPNTVSYILTGQKYISMSNVELVKLAIMENGAVTASYFSDSKYSTNGETTINGFKVTLFEYYNYAYENVGTNHAIALVGWDDTIPKEKFTVKGHTPEGDGAWLIKNSWGDSFGDGGYMWISYYDKTINQVDATIYEIAPKSEYTYNYQHDGSTAFGYGSSFSSKTYANVFEVKGSNSQEIKAVSFGLSDTNRGYSIQIYRNPEVDKPTSGTAMLSVPVTGKTTYEGYYTINLPETINVSRGDTFAVVITFDQNTRVVTSSGKNKYIGGGGSAIMNSEVSDNQSYMGLGNGFWDMYEYYNSYYMNFCIKAFAVDADDSISASTITSIQSDGNSGLLISWQKVKDGINYTLLKSTSLNGSYTTVYTGSNTSFNDNNVSRDTDYYYKIRVYDGDTPLDSKVMIGRVELTPTILRNVERVVEGIEISWDAIGVASGYKIYRSENGRVYQEIADITNASSYIDKNIKFGKIYYYYVKTYIQSDNIEESISSNTVEYFNEVPKPEFSMLDTSEKGKVILEWVENPLLDGYILYRSYWDENDTYVEMEEIIKLPAGSYDYTDDTSDMVPGRNVTYYIKGYVVQDGETLIGNYNYFDVYIPYPMVDNIKWYVSNSMLQIKWDDYVVPGITTTGYSTFVYSGMYDDIVETSRSSTTANTYLPSADYTKNYYVTVRAKNALGNTFTDEQYPRIMIGGVLNSFAVENINDIICDLNDTVTLTANMQNELENFDYQYQWYEATSKTATTGTLIPGATSMTYTFTMNSSSDKFYYCVVTGVYNGNQSAKSNIVRVSAEDDIIDIKGATINSISEQIYTGNAINPVITVNYGGKLLVNGTDYTVSYSNNTNAGIATVTVIGKGNYTGTKTTTFEILARDITSATIGNIANQTYTGSAITPGVTVTLGGKTLVKDTDYTVTYSNNVNVGTATVTITGIGNYCGSPSKASFKIVAKALENATIGTVTAQTYTGSEIKPGVAVTYNGITLKQGTDYSLSYSNNVKAGTATITITGIGEYSGTRTCNFTIKAKSFSGVTIGSISTQTYTGNAFTPGITVTDGSKRLTLGTDYTVAYSNNTNAGTATITVTGKGNYNGTKVTTFVINPRTISSATLSALPDQKYTGSAITPNVTIKYNNKTLVKGTDYTLSYSNNVDAGTATITITGKGNFSGSRTTTFKIIQDIPLSITSSNVSINQSKYVVSKITVGTTVSQLLALLDQKEYVAVYDDGVVKSGNTVLATGMQLSIVKDGKAYKNYTIVVTGDTNGDGKVNITDMLAVKAHILKKNVLSGVNFSGGDTNGDGKVNITDFIKIKGYILKKNSIEGVSVQ